MNANVYERNYMKNCVLKTMSSMVCACFIMIGCKDGNISISEGTNDTKELNQKIQNIDAESYKGLENVFSNNSIIKSESKPIMLIFGNNACKYCEELKTEIKNNKELNETIASNFQSYYINTSYSKTHEIAYLNKTMNTDVLSQYYNLSNTPLIIWLEPNGNQILKIAGYNPSIFSAMVNFVKNKEYGNEKDPKKRMQLFTQKYMQNK